MKCLVKPVGYKMNELVERVIKKYKEVHGFEPRYYEVTDMIAEAVEKKSLFLK